MRHGRGVSDLFIDLILLMIILGISSGVVTYLFKNVISPHINVGDNTELINICDYLKSYVLILDDGISYLIIANTGISTVDYRVIINDEVKYVDSLGSNSYRVYILRNVTHQDIVLLCNNVSTIKTVVVR